MTVKAGLAALFKQVEAIVKRVVSVINHFSVFNRVRIDICPGIRCLGGGGADGFNKLGKVLGYGHTPVLDSLCVAGLNVCHNIFLCVKSVLIDIGGNFCLMEGA